MYEISVLLCNYIIIIHINKHNKKIIVLIHLCYLPELVLLSTDL